LNERNEFVPLPRSLVLNLRLGYRVAVAGDRTLEIFGRVDNVTDELVVPQLGLPDPGRSLRGGLKVDF
jgi:iron complex outermembrane receptor protein